MSEHKIRVNQTGASIGIGYSQTTTAEKIGGVFNNSDSRTERELQNLVSEIQQLIKELKKDSLQNTTSELALVATQTIERIEDDFSYKKRLVGTVKKVGLATFEKTLEEATDNVIVSFIIGAVKSWIIKDN